MKKLTKELLLSLREYGIYHIDIRNADVDEVFAHVVALDTGPYDGRPYHHVPKDHEDDEGGQVRRWRQAYVVVQGVAVSIVGAYTFVAKAA